MPLPFIVVEMAPPEAPAELRATLVTACSRAAQNAECTDAPLDTLDTKAGTPTALALVTWKDDVSVRIDVSLPLEGRSLTRDVAFDAHDPVPERWRTIGLLVGTLANVVRQTESAAPPPEAPPKVEEPSPTVEADKAVPVLPQADEPRPDSRRPPSPRTGFVSVGGTLGSALDDGPVRVGAELGLGLLVVGDGFHVTAGVGYAESAGLEQGVKTSFLDALAGVAYAHSFGARVSGIFRIDALAERMAAVTTVAGADNPTSGERWRGGARVGADAYWWSGRHLGAFAGGYGRFMTGTTEVKSAGQSVGVAPALGYGVRAGVAYGF